MTAPAPIVSPEAGSRLAQLAALYDVRKREADAAEAALKTVVDGIKAELAAALPEGVTTIDLAAEGLARPLRAPRSAPATPRACSR